ncbi:hypothetical protein BDW42DRAFT_29481 [Aspergillus taichungensis]|uniref:Uncharacterized protein n=1 Tax=Aspergillus taichungensis TaxID=482145 RepID=A0A2J5HGF1_9EURO|nr:hypothetical protein BDW42DRAFT_29481 [Aspergillus taichungensis]
MQTLPPYWSCKSILTFPPHFSVSRHVPSYNSDQLSSEDYLFQTHEVRACHIVFCCLNQNHQLTYPSSAYNTVNSPKRTHFYIEVSGHRASHPRCDLCLSKNFLVPCSSIECRGIEGLLRVQFCVKPMRICLCMIFGRAQRLREFFFLNQ